MLSHALPQGNTARLLAVAAIAALAAATPPPDAIDHNVRVAEYLLLQHRDMTDRNACVAEYLLDHGDVGN